jgi:ribosome-binding protein aMBF1 (putative translation factor)
MVKRAPGAPSAARPKGAAPVPADALNPSSKDTVSPAAKDSSARSPRASAKKSPADDVLVELQVIFGENLRIARSKRGLRQYELAERTGLPQQYLSLIELGQQNVTLRTVELLAKVLGQDPSSMLRRPKGVPDKK